MNRRIEIRFAAVDGIRCVASVTVLYPANHVSFALYDAARSRPADLLTASRDIEALLRSGEWLLRFTDHPDASLPVTGVSWERLVLLREDFTLEEVSTMNALDMARLLRDEFANGTTDLDSGEFWFDPKSALGSLLVTTPKRGHFEVAATLSDDRLILNPRLTDILTDTCPSWAEVFDLVAGRLVIMDARLMVGDTIERLVALGSREGVLA